MPPLRRVSSRVRGGGVRRTYYRDHLPRARFISYTFICLYTHHLNSPVQLKRAHRSAAYTANNVHPRRGQLWNLKICGTEAIGLCRFDTLSLAETGQRGRGRDKIYECAGRLALYRSLCLELWSYIISSNDIFPPCHSLGPFSDGVLRVDFNGGAEVTIVFFCHECGLFFPP